MSPATPTIATQVNDAAIDLGDSFTDTATVTGEPGFRRSDGRRGLPDLRSGRRDVHRCGRVQLARSSADGWDGDVVAVHAAGHRDLSRDRHATAATRTTTRSRVPVVIPASRSSSARPRPRSRRRSTTRRSISASPSRTPRPSRAWPASRSPTGTVTFRIYGPNNATCTGTPVFTSANRPLTGGTATSLPFTPTAIGHLPGDRALQRRCQLRPGVRRLWRHRRAGRRVARDAGDRDAGQRRDERPRRFVHGYGDGDRRARLPDADRRRSTSRSTARTTRRAPVLRCSRPWTAR